MLAAAEAQGLEGVVGKRLESVYQPGRRSRSWIKTAIRHAHEVIIAGWAPGSGNRRDSLGALLLAVHDDTGELVYVGDVGTGFTDAARHRLLTQLRPLQRSEPPFTGEFLAPAAGPDAHRPGDRCTGSNRGWWGRSSTGPSPATAASAIPPGGDYARTGTRTRSTSPTGPSRDPRPRPGTHLLLGGSRQAQVVERVIRSRHGLSSGPVHQAEVDLGPVGSVPGLVPFGGDPFSRSVGRS